MVVARFGASLGSLVEHSRHRHIGAQLLDAGSAALVWCGATSGGSRGGAAAVALQCAKLLAATRAARPYVAVYDEGESMARVLQCRLYPLHNESEAEQLRQLPDLALLSPAERVALGAKMFFSDCESLGQFERRMNSL